MPIKLIGMRAIVDVLNSRKYKGNRTRSKTDGLILSDFLRNVFEHNHLCKVEDRLTDETIQIGRAHV